LNLCRLLVTACVAVAALITPTTLWADSNTTVLQVLNNADVYVSNSVYQHHDAHPGDLHRLQAAADNAYNQNVAVKVALLEQFPSNIHTAAQAADNIRNFEDFSGVVIVVWPGGIGVSSDVMTSSEQATVVRQAAPLCAGSFTACAIAAVKDAIPIVKSEQSSAYRSAAIFWIVTFVVVALVIAAAVLYFRRRTSRTLAQFAAYGGVSDPDAAHNEAAELPARFDAGGFPEPNRNPPSVGG